MEVLHLQDIIQDMEDNFDYKKYIAEGTLLKEDLEQAKKDAIEGVKDYADRHAANIKIYMDALMKYDIGSEEVKKAKLATEKGLEDLGKEIAEGRLLKENEGKDAMLDFIKVVQKSPNEDEILEAFEKVMDGIFGKGIMQKDVSTLVDKAQGEI